MTCTTKRTPQSVARPSARGPRSTGKVVPGAAAELGRHVPVDDRELKPWKQASRSYPRFRAGKVVTRRNAGRDDGRTWMSGRYVCGAGLEEDWSDESDESDPGYEEDKSGRRGEAFVEGEGERTEVAIMEIAKPMKLRGSARDYEIVGTTRPVVVLEDDEEWEWVGDVGLERDDDHWETVGETVSSRDSYATVLQRQVA